MKNIVEKIKSTVTEVVSRVSSFKEKVSFKKIGSLLKEKGCALFKYLCSWKFTEEFAKNICILAAVVCAWDKNKISMFLFLGMYFLKGYIVPYKEDWDQPEQDEEDEAPETVNAISFEKVQQFADNNNHPKVVVKGQTESGENIIDWDELERRIISRVYE